MTADRTETTVRVRCVQMTPLIADHTGNIRRIEHEIRRGASDGVDLLVLPELATSGYALTAEEARAAALAADCETFIRWAGLLGDRLTAVIGFCEDGGDAVYNSALVLVPGSEPVVYRKLHLWDSEKLVFAPGSSEPPVVETPFGRLGTLICYDLEFPEMPRSVALRGADVIAVPTNWPLLERPVDEHAPEVVQAMAAARASGVAIACCDRSGDERGIAWTEGTCIVGTDGWIVASSTPGASTPEHPGAEATIPLRPERRRIGERNDLFRDRREQFYARLLSDE